MTPRRELAVAVVLAAAAGALGLLAASRPWIELRVLRDAPLPPAEAAVAGGTVSPLVPGLALVVLAAAAGLLATRRWGRLAIGVLVVVAGIGMLLAALPWLGAVALDPARDVATEVDLPAGMLASSGRDGPWVAIVAGTLAVLGGLLSTVRSTRWPAMGARYDAPAARRPQGPAPAGAGGPEASDRETWDALDRGEDPTTSR